MLKKLKAKFILATVLSLLIVITVIVGAINAFNYKSVISDADKTLQLIMDNKGRFPNKPGMIKPDPDIHITPESPFEARYFTVFFENGEVTSVNTASIAAVDYDKAVNMASAVITHKVNKGFWGNYRFLASVDGEKISIIFLDCTRSLDAANTFLILSVFISLLGIIAVFLLVWIISDRIVKPIADGYEKQKRFITDAGHDIKTPITIIDADAELIEMELGESEWLTDIKKQTARMASLTNDLIYLSRMEEPEITPHVDFPLSEVAEEVVNSFGAPAKSKNIKINLSTDPALFYCGDEESIKKLFTILIDNAVKYSPAGENIELSVKKQGRGIRIQISNVAPELTDATIKRMFDRFYRSDSARSSGGGFGIGLSVANAIVASHKGKISAHKDGGRLIIEAILL